MTTVEGQTTTNTTDIDDLKKRTTKAGNQITNVTNTVNNHTTQITNLRGDTNKNSKAIAGQGQKIANLGQRVQSLEDLESKEVDSINRVNGFDSRITSVEKNTEKALDGVALAIALADPVLAGDAVFGIRGNWGAFDGRNAWGVSEIGILDKNVFGGGETLGLAGSIGAMEHGDVGGRVGLQMTWK